MTGRTWKLKVVKRDGTTEEYFHTKVVGTTANALGATGQADIAVAEEFAEAVTFFLHRSGERRNISTSEILSIIEMVLAGTGFEQEAIALSEHHFQRKLMRSRVEVVRGQSGGLAGAEELYEDGKKQVRSRWDKSRIAEDLIGRQGLDRQTARTIASMVEEKVFNMGLTVVPAALVEQLVLNDAEAILKAQQQLQTV
ncbi:MAG: ATP cone domain-containing protein [Planctomycetota bacterium]